MASLHIEGLGKRYGRAGDWALRDFSLTVEDGELVAIVGPSGCGKSTLLRMLAGLEPESAGTITLGGRALNGLPPKDRDLALMFQSYTLLPHLTVEENLAFGLKLRGVAKGERLARAREAAETLGLTRLLGRLPSEISGGERQRAALGRAILRAPSAFLFDEPLSSLDAQMRLQLRVEIQRLHQRVRVPMLFVTHDQSEALTLGDRVLVLNHGAIQQIAPPDELYRRPANAFVASFIGAPGMNLFAGRVETDATGARRFASGAFSCGLPHGGENAGGGFGALADGEALTLGVRPEHLRRVDDAAQGLGPLIRGIVTAVERHAGQTTVYLEQPDAHGSPEGKAVAFAARVTDSGTTGASAAVRPGDRLAWTFDPVDAHGFAGPGGTRVG